MLLFVGKVVRRQACRFMYTGSDEYWRLRYLHGGDSGAGSVGELGAWKAGVLSRLAAEADVESVLDLGCGDGRLVAQAVLPGYLGLDVSDKCLDTARVRCDGMRFGSYPRDLPDSADMCMSVDVVDHLTEGRAWQRHLRDLFRTATRMVVIYGTDRDENPLRLHLRYREFTGWIGRNLPGWRLQARIIEPHMSAREEIEGETLPAFYLYEPR